MQLTIQVSTARGPFVSARGPSTPAGCAGGLAGIRSKSWRVQAPLVRHACCRVVKTAESDAVGWGAGSPVREGSSPDCCAGTRHLDCIDFVRREGRRRRPFV